MDSLLYYIWLSLRCGAGSEAANILLSKFSSPKEVYEADRYALCEALPGRESTAKALCDKDISMAEKILEYCQRANVGVLTQESNVYPNRLRAIPSSPIVLYYKGVFPKIDEKVAIACVGTRKCSDSGARIAYKLGADLARAKAMVVSGMALGIDAMCARGTLAERGHTIAVLGCGIDIVYPRENEALMKAICEKGTVITEYAPGTPPSGKNFPMRNRIIAGLSLGTVIVEADIRSGALITAEYARKQGKDIFAFPGDVESTLHKGTNELISGGAHMVRSAREILFEYEHLWQGKIFPENIDGGKYYTGKARPSYIGRGSDTYEKKINAVNAARHMPAEKAPPFEVSETAQDLPLRRADGKKARPESAAPELCGMEKLVWESLDGAMTADEIAAAVRRKNGGRADVGEVLCALTTLEVKGLCKSLPGGIFCK